MKSVIGKVMPKKTVCEKDAERQEANEFYNNFIVACANGDFTPEELYSTFPMLKALSICEYVQMLNEHLKDFGLVASARFKVMTDEGQEDWIGSLGYVGEGWVDDLMQKIQKQHLGWLSISYYVSIGKKRSRWDDSDKKPENPSDRYDTYVLGAERKLEKDAFSKIHKDKGRNAEGDVHEGKNLLCDRTFWEHLPVRLWRLEYKSDKESRKQAIDECQWDLRWHYNDKGPNTKLSDRQVEIAEILKNIKRQIVGRAYKEYLENKIDPWETVNADFVDPHLQNLSSSLDVDSK